jgi:murein DD-endopeptidase MepM/ murein hydrolase activator NlpD
MNYGVFISPLPAGWRNFGGVAAHNSRPLGNWQSDNAIDMAAPPGTPCFAVDDGIVDPGAGFGFRDNGSTVWGARLTLKTAEGARCFYTHLGRYARGIAPGVAVKQGQLLGWLGNPPRFAAHLHFGVQPPANPELIAARPARPETLEEELRARSGFFAWASWHLGVGEWKRFGPRNAQVRPDVPAKVPRAWWRRLQMFVTPRPKPVSHFR